ncbi:MAG: PKD domain-containing protein, partial [Bacteroidia bacterium]|nr:PKD domain-containing protein [Bacteroidia bacterium]
MKNIYKPIIILILSIFPLLSRAQSMAGTEFWLAFEDNSFGAASLSVFISSTVANSATVTAFGGGGCVLSQTVAVPANSTVQVNVPIACQVTTSGVVEAKAIRVTTTANAYVYALNQAFATTDASIVLPTPLLGTDYLVITHNGIFGHNQSQFIVVATQNNTQLQIIPSVATQNGWAAGSVNNITLNQGQVIQVKATGDLTGSRVRSQGSNCGSVAPFAVFAGNICDNVGGCTWCDHIYEQIFPMSRFGTQYVTVPLRTRQGGDIIRVMAIANNTTVSVDGVPQSPVLNCGQYITFPANQFTIPRYITANNPIAVAQFSRGQACDGVVSDPFFLLLAPINNLSTTNVTVSGMNLTTFSSHNVNVVTASTNTANINCPGCTPAGAWVAVGGGSGLSAIQYQLPSAGNTTITSTGTGFYVTVYGFGNFDSYGYAGGGQLPNTAFQVTVSATNVCVGSPVTFTATSSLPISNVTWDFGDGTTGTGTSVNKTYNACGTYTINATITAGTGPCGNYPNSNVYCVSQQVTVVPAPNLSLGTAGPLCQGSSATLPLTISGMSCGNPPVNHPWSVSYSINGTPQTPLTGTGNSTVNIPGLNNLQSNTTVTITAGVNTNNQACTAPSLP